MAIDKQNLTELVENYTQDLYSWAIHKVSDNEMAKDLVQDAFLAAAEKIAEFEGKSSPKTWLFSILNHKIIDFYRKKANQPVRIENQTLSNYFDTDGNWNIDSKPMDWGNDDDNLLDDDNLQSALNNCMDKLPDKWLACVRLKYFFNKKGDEICQELEIAPTNLWQIIHRSKLQLRECVEKCRKYKI